MDCIFCKIGAGEIPAEIVYKSSDTVVFLDIHPRAPGHLVVIPKTHKETILDLSLEELKSFFESVKNATDLLRKRLAPDGFTLGINHGKVAGQEVDHLHFHIIPRYKNDGGSSLQSIVNNQSTKSIKEIADEIRKEA